MNLRRFSAVGLFAACLSFPAAAGDITVSDAWARASVGGTGGNSAAYMTLTTEGEGDRLVAVATPLAARAELHGHSMEDGVAKMHPVDTVEVTPDEPAILEPGGLHVMLMGLTEALEVGASLPLTLSFEKAGDITVDATVHPLSHRPKTKHRH